MLRFPGSRPPNGEPAGSQTGEGEPLVWLHVADPALGPAVRCVAEALCHRDAAPGILTTEVANAGPDAVWPPLVETTEAPGDPRALRQLVSGHRPDLLVWFGTALHPPLVAAAARANLALLLVAAEGVGPERPDTWRGGAMRRSLQRFHRLLVTTRESEVLLTRHDVAPDRIAVMGPFVETATPLSFDAKTHGDLAACLVERPAWVAVAVPEAEEWAVLRAHALAMRGVHRLLLILLTPSPEAGAVHEARLRAAGWSVTRRGEGALPLEETQIYLVDYDTELGLWYRLASIAFLGGTLAGEGGPNPFEPAALGAAILHGPITGAHARRYARLAAAGAARRIADAEALGEELGDLVAPDRAAELARAGWDVISTGAGAIDTVCDTILSMLGIEADDVE